METIKLGIEGLDAVEQIGKGGTSRVYRARQADLDREVALKVINAGDDPEVLKRFDRERKAMGRLSLNEGIVPVYSSGLTARGEPYLVMPYYANGSLADLMATGPMPWQHAVDYITAVARTMAAAHDADVVHLDLKPANILLSSEGAPRIADFGIAKLLGEQSSSRSTGASFTPTYSAPEILLGEEISPAADVYGLGATLWALLAGRPPFRSDDGGDNSLMAVATRVVHEPAGDLRSLAPSPICDVIETAMAKRPDERQPTAGAFARALTVARKSADRDAGSRPNRLGPVTPSYLTSVAGGSLGSGRSGSQAPLAPAVAAATAARVERAGLPDASSDSTKTLEVGDAGGETGRATKPQSGPLHFEAPVPPRFVPAIGPIAVDDVVHRYGPIASFAVSVLILVGAVVFVVARGGPDDTVTSTSTTSAALTPVASLDDATASVSDRPERSTPAPAGPATSASTTTEPPPATSSTTTTEPTSTTTATTAATTTASSTTTTTTSSTSSSTTETTTATTSGSSSTDTTEPDEAPGLFPITLD